MNQRSPEGRPRKEETVEPQTDLSLEISSIALVDTHEHLWPEDMWAGDNERLIEMQREAGQPGWGDVQPDILQDLFSNYPTSDLATAGASSDALSRLFDPAAGDIEQRFSEIRAAWEATKHTGYGEAVRLIAREIYGLDELTIEGLERAQGQLQQLRQPGERLRLLAEVARLDHVQIDDFRLVCEPDASGPDFFLYDLSWANFANGDLKPDEIAQETGIEVSSLEDLREAMAALFEHFAPCAIAVKSQHAYQRTLRWEERSDDEAAKALAGVLAGSEADEGTRLALGDWCLARGVELATKHNLPFKIHTGHLAGNGGMQIEQIRAANLCPLLARYPDARFVLMHTAYPYTDEIISIAKHYPNVWVDLCWAWSINPYSSTDFVRRFLHAVPANKLFAFGGDTFWPTAAIAYSIQARKGLQRALEAEVATGDITETEAIALARRLMRENQYDCFDIEGTRAAVQAQLEPASVE
jgi:predicted TIM-barrel fold metal-dependent hydrolase